MYLKLSHRLRSSILSTFTVFEGTVLSLVPFCDVVDVARLTHTRADMHSSHAKPPRSGRRAGNTSLLARVLRRCFPHFSLRRAVRYGNAPARRFFICALLLLIALLLVLLVVLCVHLVIAENERIAAYLHLTGVSDGSPPDKKILLLESAPPAEVQELRASLKRFAPRTRGPVPRLRQNRFLTSYFDLEERVLPPLTKSALEAWFSHESASPGAAEDVLLQHAWGNTSSAAAAHDANADHDLFHLLAFLYPPQQQQGYYRAALNGIIGFGPRVGGTRREPLLHHLLHEGLGRAHYDAAQHRYRNAPHLSEKGVELLEKAASTWPSAPDFAPAAAAGAKEQNTHETDRVAGWRWSLVWDNFSAPVPIAVEGQFFSPSVNLQNLVFQFPGGSQFRRKRAALARPDDVFVGRRCNPLAVDPAQRQNMFPAETYSRNDTEGMYVQEWFIGRGEHPMLSFYQPSLHRGKPGTVVEIHTPGQPVPLKPPLSFPVADPVSRQPIRHAVYAAHWDSMRSATFRFLGACDSAVPMVYLLRTIKNIAVLTDVAEALTESYKEERVGAGGVVAEGVVVPGLTATFRRSTTAAEVRARLARLLSPAHHALLFQYFFARSYTVGSDNHTTGAAGATDNYAHEVEVDVRRWLDWAQHLPALSIVLFDAEEAFKKWEGSDHTYGSRHLAQQWRAFTTATQTRYSGGPQSLFDAVDLFALYDLMGPAGTNFPNFFPTQSGIYYAALAQRETEKRRRAFRDASAITAELLWRVMGEPNAGAGAGENASTAQYLRQLGTSVDVAVAALAKQHVTKVLAAPSSRPTLEMLPRPWLMYGTPHEMLTLHRISLPDFREVHSGIGSVTSYRVFDSVSADLVAKADFDVSEYLRTTNENIFFEATRATQLRRLSADPVLEDDHLHWLDTQRVLHLIPSPFPQSWHTQSDDGQDIHDGTTVDLANVLWSTVLELGHYWTGAEDVAKAEVLSDK
ncbi:putative mitochondrial glutaminyl cyclase [Leptomonas pyrrhocoris]|uniref:Putative mitochondrial glutaminyl cyclase n=1 Tax=Leptomonas pyrrhocoris TaxID=157538 RepID=A0A0N0DQQ6_LEPPY|nr:putative mitochondrial glutaminyl cyclase [Leptomonas pyrrhocoris]KPA73361.1 putative mitochondrial glutaminyl cyclase [Leptomonas pyrrhocoris]|eukprot:XP_015651800.1 putative mitochondrial glutaminyl cyclase [Leptomonas pyrrhocoris]